MTTHSAEAFPLTNPVPGAWIQMTDTSMPPVYVPFEAQTRRDERTNREIVTGYGPGAHIKRLLTEGATYADVVAGAPSVQSSGPSEEALRAQLATAQAAQEQLMEELATLRAQMESDHALPNAGKRAAR